MFFADSTPLPAGGVGWCAAQLLRRVAVHSFDGEVTTVEVGRQAAALGVTVGSWVVEVGSDRGGDLTAVDSQSQVKEAITAVIRSRENKFVIVTRKVGHTRSSGCARWARGHTGARAHTRGPMFAA